MSLFFAKERTLLTIAMAVAGFLASCSPKAPPPRQMPARPVETAVAVQRDVGDYIDVFGSLNVIDNIDVKSRVEAQIKACNFKEGDFVKRGDKLVSMDADTFVAAHNRAKAVLDGDTAALALAKVTFERNQKLRAQKLISEEDFDRYKSEWDQAAAQVEQDKANLEMARLNLEYCEIRSPIDGVTGKLEVDPGNIVAAYTGPTLVNVKSIDPLYIDFTVSEKRLADIRNSMASGVLEVQCFIRNGGSNSFLGRLEFMDNKVDNVTGTIMLRAVVPNKDRALWPGQFVDVRLILAKLKDAILVPYSAVQIGEKGHFLYVVTADGKVELRELDIGLTYGDLVAIKSGVKTGERVVTKGQLGLWHGAPVVDVTAVKH